MRIGSLKFFMFYSLHALGSLAIPIFLFLLTSCTEKEPDKIDDGPEASAQQVSIAFTQATSGKTLANSKQGDWVLFETTQRIFTSNPESTSLTAKEMYEMIENNGLYDLQILKSVYDISVKPPIISNQSIEKCQVLLDGSQHSCNYSPLAVSTSSTTSKLTGPDLSQYHFSRIDSNNQIHASAGGTSSYHNLSTTSRTTPPPALVSAKPNCGDVPKCQLAVKTIEFDEIRMENGERTRFHHEFDFSPDVPFLGVVLRHCVRWNYKTENRYLPAMICDTVVNFLYGT